MREGGACEAVLRCRGGFRFTIRCNALRASAAIEECVLDTDDGAVGGARVDAVATDARVDGGDSDVRLSPDAKRVR